MSKIFFCQNIYAASLLVLVKSCHQVSVITNIILSFVYIYSTVCLLLSFLSNIYVPPKPPPVYGKSNKRDLYNCLKQDTYHERFIALKFFFYTSCRKISVSFSNSCNNSTSSEWRKTEPLCV